uniref:SAM domain-containing protein n=1 Tax=Denticeps clupeoides TaxID=299321 RepID=A0AAY4DZB1_9TELE
MEDSAANAAAPDFDVYRAMDWKDGVGTLPGSELKFRVNEFGVLEVITSEADDDSVKKAHATTTWSVPTAQEGKLIPVKEERPWAQRGLVCVRCQRKGSAVDFLPDGRHCSERCLQQDQQECLGCHLQRFFLFPAVPYGGKKKSWCWASYLEEEKSVAAPSKSFKEHQSYPQSKNGFRVGMKLEGVDPEHPSMYCVLTVAEVSGHRIRLHFDKHSDCYDFWVNSNSPDIHPAGWCEKTGHKLHPPKGMKDEEFSWSSYVKMNKGQAAPKALFENQNTMVTPLGFRIGMKLEAIDKKNPSLICVATVTDMVDNRFLVHFDNWDESYDYWCDATSPYIHPIGWCQENGRTLTTPPGYQSEENFSWEKYLEETGSSPAPARAFKVKPPHSFQIHMKLEAVDKRNPMLVRVATVVDSDDHRIKIHFDGWTDEYDYWVDTDSPDIHPAGWCAKTSHPLQPPISPLEMFESSEQGGCPTPGCKGVGHIKGARYSGHHSAVGCPYSDINISKGSVLPDRLSGEMPGTGVGRPRRAESSSASAAVNQDASVSPPFNLPVVFFSTVNAQLLLRGCCPGLPSLIRRVLYSVRVGRPSKKKVEEPLTLQQALHQSVFMPSGSSSPTSPHCWDQHSKLLPTVAGITASKVAAWTVEQVTEFIQALPGCKEQVRTFRDEQIDGEAFLLLTQVDLVKILSIKLGPALKIYNSILMFKTTEDSASNEL